MSTRRDKEAIGRAGESQGIDVHRREFLQAVQHRPAADTKFKQLARAAEDISGAALAVLIEDWSIECHLATRAATQWWIFDHIARWLGRLAGDFQEFGLEGDEENRQELRSLWYSYSSIGRFVPLPEELPFRLHAHNPAAATLDEYRAAAREAFDTYLDDYIGRQPESRIPETREREHYDWLVRHQMLGETYKKIAESVNRAESTIHTEVNDLRKLIILPPPRKSGRPRIWLAGL
jgi:hypothetical protein